MTNSKKYRLVWNRDVDVTGDIFGDEIDYILNLPKGFKLTYDPLNPTHVRGYDSKKELLADIKNVVPCTCKECVGP